MSNILSNPVFCAFIIGMNVGACGMQMLFVWYNRQKAEEDKS